MNFTQQLTNAHAARCQACFALSQKVYIQFEGVERSTPRLNVCKLKHFETIKSICIVDLLPRMHCLVNQTDMSKLMGSASAADISFSSPRLNLQQQLAALDVEICSNQMNSALSSRCSGQSISTEDRIEAISSVKSLKQVSILSPQIVSTTLQEHVLLDQFQ